MRRSIEISQVQMLGSSPTPPHSPAPPHRRPPLSGALWLGLCLAGCGSPPPVLATPDSGLVEQAMRAARPGPLLDLPALIDSILSTHSDSDSDCPLLEILAGDDSDEGAPLRERWTGGGCQSGDLLIDGVLEHLLQDGEQWLAGENFSISRLTPDGPVPLVFLDGAIAIVEQDDLLLLNASASWCGGPDAPCTDGPTTVDLSFSLFPADGYPDAYDVTVSGVVARQAPIMLEGSWSIDLSACSREPTDGAFALRRGERHDLTLDGALRCDACASWIVQGVDTAPFCSVPL